MNKAKFEKQFISVFFMLIGLIIAGCSTEHKSRPLDCSYRGLVFIKNSSTNGSRENLKQCGYAEVDVTGIWTRGFEKNQFISDGTNNEKWWVDWFADSRLDALTTQDYEQGFTVARVRLTGYLSPLGSYGHLGGYRREIVITNFNQIALLNTKPQ